MNVHVHNLLSRVRHRELTGGKADIVLVNSVGYTLLTEEWWKRSVDLYEPLPELEEPMFIRGVPVVPYWNEEQVERTAALVMARGSRVEKFLPPRRAL